MDNKNIANFVIASLISADNLLTKEDCKEAESELVKICASILNSDEYSIDEKISYINRISKCLDICKRDFDFLNSANSRS